MGTLARTVTPAALSVSADNRLIADGRSGLSSAEAARRLTEFGPNEIRRERAVGTATLLARQLFSPVIWLLLAASVLSAIVGEPLDAVAIGTIVIINAAIGFFQEHRARRAVMALRSMTAPRARVMRGGHSAIIPASEVVPGDLLVLEAGDITAVDARLLGAHALSAYEAPLTGESAPVDKKAAPTMLALLEKWGAQPKRENSSLPRDLVVTEPTSVGST